MFDLTKFTMGGMTECGQALRGLSATTRSMEEAAHKVVQYLYDHFIDPETGEKIMSQVRLFKTHDYEDLLPELKNFAAGMVNPAWVRPDMKCLTLLATVGEKPEWNRRETSEGHKAIPLPSVELVRKFPMISNLVKQFGLELSTVVDPDPTCLQDLEETTYNVFLVPDAQGSKYIPDQDDFVIPCGIRSVLGFGGILPSGNLYAIIMFSKVVISPEVAALFRPLALSVKIALLQHDDVKVFSDDG